MESAFWIFLYEVLLYLKHPIDTLVLYEQLQLINTILMTGSAVARIIHYSANRRILSWSFCEDTG